MSPAPGNGRAGVGVGGSSLWNTLFQGPLHLTFQLIKLPHRFNARLHFWFTVLPAQVLKLDFRMQSLTLSEVRSVLLQVTRNQGTCPAGTPLGPAPSSAVFPSPLLPHGSSVSKFLPAPQVPSSVPLLLLQVARPPFHGGRGPSYRPTPFGMDVRDGLRGRGGPALTPSSPIPACLAFVPSALGPTRVTPLNKKRGQRVRCGPGLPDSSLSTDQPVVHGEGRASCVPVAASPGESCVARTF